MTFADLTEVSRDILSIAQQLQLLPDLVVRDQTGLVKAALNSICRALCFRYKSFQDAADHFRRTRSSPEPLRVRDKRYASAHATAIEEGYQLVQRLCLETGHGGYNKPFDLATVTSNWGAIKGILSARLGDEWQRDFRAIPGAIEDELQQLHGSQSSELPRHVEHDAKEAYVLSNVIGWEDYFPTYKQFTDFLEKTPQIRSRKTSSGRRVVHAADWRKYWSAHPEKQFDFLDARPEVLDAIATAQRRKRQQEQRKGRK